MSVVSGLNWRAVKLGATENPKGNAPTCRGVGENPASERFFRGRGGRVLARDAGAARPAGLMLSVR